MSAVFNLLIAVVISQFLGPDGKGQQGIIITTIAFILVFSNLIGGATLVYLIPRHRFSLLILPSYFWSIIISLISFFILKTTNLVDNRFIINICILSVLNSYTSINSTILIGKEKIKTANLIAFLQPLITVISLIILFIFLKQKNVTSYLISLYFSFGITFLISLFYVNKYFDTFKFHTLREYFVVIKDLGKYGLLNQLAHIFQLLSFRLSYYWLDHFFGESSVGVYSNGASLIESVWLISKSISLVQYARIANTDDIKYSQKLTINLTKVSIIFSLVLIIPLIVLPASFYTFIFGQGFGSVNKIIWTLAPGIIFFNFALVIGHYFSGTGKYYINTISSLTGLVVSIILFSIMIPLYNNIGAGIATSISYIVTSIMVLIFFLKESKVNPKQFYPTKTDFRIFTSEVKKIVLHKVFARKHQ